MVELVHAGRSPEELAQEFEPTAQSIRNWVGQANCDAGRRGNGLTTAEREVGRRAFMSILRPKAFSGALTIAGPLPLRGSCYRAPARW